MSETRITGYIPPLYRDGTGQILLRVPGDALNDIPIGDITPAPGQFTDLAVHDEVISDLSMAGNSLVNCQSIANLASQGTALHLDGIDDFVNLDALAAELVNVNSTEGAIIWKGKIHDFTTAYLKLWSFGDTSEVEYIYMAIDSIDYKISVNCVVAGTNQWVLQTDNTFDEDVKYEVFVAHDGVTPVLYVNGKLEPTTFTTSTDITKWFSDTPGVDNGRLGCVNINGAGNSTFLNCTVNKFYALNVCPTAAEVLALYEGGNVPFKWIGADMTDLVSGWDFTSGWAADGGCSIDDADSISSVASGGIHKNYNLITGMRYRIELSAGVVVSQAALFIGSAGGQNLGTLSTGVNTIDFTVDSPAANNNVRLYLGSNSSIDVASMVIYRVGAVGQYEQDGITESEWFDKSGNGFNATIDGATPINLSKTVFADWERISVSEMGLPSANPPAKALYGIAPALEFTVNTDHVEYKIRVPSNWVPGTDIVVHAHWTKSTDDDDQSGKFAKWQLKYLSVDENENVNAGESTLTVEDEYPSAVTTTQVEAITANVTIPAAALAAHNTIYLQLMAVTPVGVALDDEPAIIAVDYKIQRYAAVQ